jgi:hypothetical protein
MSRPAVHRRRVRPARAVRACPLDRLLVETVTRAFPAREHEQFVAHYRGLLGAWVADQA